MVSVLSAVLVLALATSGVKSDASAVSRKPAKKKADPKCDLYLAPLKVQRGNGFQTGIYAGRNFHQNELLDIAHSVLMKSAAIEEWQIYDHSFETESRDYEMHLFGFPMMLPFHVDGNVYHFWTEEETTDIPLSPPNPYSDFDSVSFYSRTGISAGDELLLKIEGSEEDDEASTSEEDDDFAPHKIEELRRVGHCLSNVYVDDSEISQAGKGLFTNKFVKKGQIATISPMLVLPRHKVEKQNPNSLLINYCISQNNTDMALLPVGLAGMINHNNGVNGDVANLHMEWHSWDSPGGRSRVKWEATPLEAAEFPPLYIKYVANRDIYAGEELTISYGDEWEHEWKKYDEAARSAECGVTEKVDASDDSLKDLQFRHYIMAPEGLFPKNFESICIGKNQNDCTLLEAKRRMTFDEALKNKFNNGPEMAAAYREKIFQREKDSPKVQNTCQRTKKEMPLVYSKVNPPNDNND